MRTPEENRQLCDRYPFLDCGDESYETTWADDMPEGWWSAFGEQLCEEIKKELIRCKFLDEYEIIQIKEKWGCYDDETEVLTNNGWKYFKDVTYDDSMVTLNHSSQQIEYQTPTDIISYHYKGDMYELENRGISIKVTPNHNLYVAKGSYYNGQKNNEKHIYDMELCTPDKYFGKDKRFLKSGKWIGEKPDDNFIIKGYSTTREYCTRTYVNDDVVVNIHSFLKFLGYYVAEGCCNPEKGEITIARDRSEYKTKLVNDLIIGIGFKPRDATNYKLDNNGGVSKFYNVVFAKWLYENCGHYAWNKRTPDFIKTLPPEYIEEFLTYLYLGDGHKTKTSNILTTTSKQLSDDVQELLLKAGYGFKESFCPVGSRSRNSSFINGRQVINKHDVYEINWLKLNYIEIDNSKVKISKSFVEKWSEYDGDVYCVTVPNHIIYIRRHGKGVWCGNSLRWYDDGIPEGCKVWDIIEKYSVLSENICAFCGKPDVPMMTWGWVLPMCYEHANNKEEYEECAKKQYPHRMPDFRKWSQYNENGEWITCEAYIGDTAEKIRRRWNANHIDG